MADASDLRRRLIRARDASVEHAARRDIVPGLKQILWRDTGETAERTAVVDVRSTGTSTTATIEAPTPQANYMEEGTQPHIIRPRRAKALRFHVGGRVVFAKMVRHPGTRPDPRFFPFIRQHWPTAVTAAWRQEISR